MKSKSDSVSEGGNKHNLHGALGPPPIIRRYWRSQITAHNAKSSDDDLPSYKRLDDWKEVFEGRKKKNKEERAKEEKTHKEMKREEEEAAKKRARTRALVDKLLATISSAITAKLISHVMEFVVLLLECVGDAVTEHGDGDGASLANALSALACTFRFVHKGKHKMAYIRREMVAPVLLARVKRLVDRDNIQPETLALTVSTKLNMILRTSSVIQRAISHISNLPIVALMHERALGSTSIDNIESDILKSSHATHLDNAFMIASAALKTKLMESIQDLTAPILNDDQTGTVTDIMSVVVGVVIAAIYKTVSGSHLIDTLASEMTRLMSFTFSAAKGCSDLMSKAHVVAGNAEEALASTESSEKLCVDVEKRFEALNHAIRCKVDDAMAVVKACIVGQEGEEDENDDTGE